MAGVSIVNKNMLQVFSSYIALYHGDNDAPACRALPALIYHVQVHAVNGYFYFMRYTQIARVSQSSQNIATLIQPFIGGGSKKRNIRIGRCKMFNAFGHR